MAKIAGVIMTALIKEKRYPKMKKMAAAIV